MHLLFIGNANKTFESNLVSLELLRTKLKMSAEPDGLAVSAE